MFITGVAAMTFDPMPADFMPCLCLVKRHPQILILDWFFCRRFPAAFFPAVHPVVNALEYVFRIGIQRHVAAIFQRAERLDNGRQLHAIVGGLGLATENIFTMVAPYQQCAPATNTGIPPAGAICINLNFLYQNVCGIGESLVLPGHPPPSVWTTSVDGWESMYTPVSGR